MLRVFALMTASKSFVTLLLLLSPFATFQSKITTPISRNVTIDKQEQSLIIPIVSGRLHVSQKAASPTLSQSCAEQFSCLGSIDYLLYRRGIVLIL